MKGAVTEIIVFGPKDIIPFAGLPATKVSTDLLVECTVLSK